MPRPRKRDSVFEVRIHHEKMQLLQACLQAAVWFMRQSRYLQWTLKNRISHFGENIWHHFWKIYDIDFFWPLSMLNLQINGSSIFLRNYLPGVGLSLVVSDKYGELGGKARRIWFNVAKRYLRDQPGCGNLVGGKYILRQLTCLLSVGWYS